MNINDFKLLAILFIFRVVRRTVTQKIAERTKENEGDMVKSTKTAVYLYHITDQAKIKPEHHFLFIEKTRQREHDQGGRGYRRHEKPPFSYITLIAMAIKARPNKKATLQQINDWLINNFVFFRGDYNGWKNSVRHNLSLNDCFTKILRDPSRPWGKDNYWTISKKCSYIFKDGVFRRRKKIKEEHLPIVPTPFTIDWILALPSSRPVSPARSDAMSDNSISSISPSSSPPQSPRMPDHYPKLYPLQMPYPHQLYIHSAKKTSNFLISHILT